MPMPLCWEMAAGSLGVLRHHMLVLGHSKYTEQACHVRDGASSWQVIEQGFPLFVWWHWGRAGTRAHMPMLLAIWWHWE